MEADVDRAAARGVRARALARRRALAGDLDEQTLLRTLLDVYVTSLRRGHANLLCIVRMFKDDPRRESAGDLDELLRVGDVLRDQGGGQVLVALVGWHYSSNAACLVRVHLF